jgi:hypothetical protein
MGSGPGTVNGLSIAEIRIEAGGVTREGQERLGVLTEVTALEESLGREERSLWPEEIWRFPGIDVGQCGTAWVSEW